MNDVIVNLRLVVDSQGDLDRIIEEYGERETRKLFKEFINEELIVGLLHPRDTSIKEYKITKVTFE